MQKLNEKYMSLAINEAKKAKKLGDLPFGAVIVCEGKVVGKGKCENGTIGDVTDHAELLALREACKKLGRNNLPDCVIYCTNEPCNMCASGIFQAKIAKVVVGLTRDDLPDLLRRRNIRIQDLINDSGFKISLTEGILKKEILAIFQDVEKK